MKPVSCNGGSDGRLEVNGTGGTGPYSYSWNTVPTPTLGNVIDNLIIGNYTVTMTDTNGCTFDTTLSIGEPDTLFVNAQGFDAKCFGSSDGYGTALGGGGVVPYTFFWEITPGIFQINDTAVNLDTGIYIVLIKDKNNCQSTDTIIVNQPTEVIATASSGDTICALEPVNISASATGGSGPYTYTWVPFFGTTGNSGTVAPAVSTIYSVVAVDSKQCESDPQLIHINVRTLTNDLLDITTSGDICEGDSASIFALHVGLFGNYSYKWSSGQTGFGTYYVSPDTSIYYVFTVTDPCLNELKDSVLINVNPNPLIDLPLVFGQGCQPLRVPFTDTANTQSGLTYFWEFGDGNGSNQASPSYIYSNPGTYNAIVTITSEKGCKSSNGSNPSLVIVQETPEAIFTASPIVTDERTPVVTLTNLTKGDDYIYKWHFGDGDTTSLKDPKPHVYADTGKYTIILIASTVYNCADTTALEVIINPYYRLEIPNAFTPNPDGSSGGRWDNKDLRNYIFYPFTTTPEGVESYSMKIFNRWGELLFETTDIYTGWDGYYRGKIATQEVYVYKIKLTWENGQEEDAFGDVTLFR
jgi:gliding motility-associated-like protein